MRVVIAEDSLLVREGIIRCLEIADIDVVAAVDNPDELLHAVGEHLPDLAVIDVRMPPTNTNEGLRAALTIRDRWPEVAVLVLSQFVEERYATDLLSGETRGLGYLLKHRVANVGDFLEALRRVAAGGTALDPEVVSQLLLQRRDDPLAQLSQREREVLALMAEGRSNSGIASVLSISESAVAKHVNSIFTRLDLTLADKDHRRVLAVVQFLQARAGG